MGKRAPLRKQSQQSSSSSSSSSGERTKKSKLNDGQQKFRGIDDHDNKITEIEQDDDDNDDDDNDEDDDLDLTKQQEGTMEEFTFEFNDMKDEYMHGVRTILNQFIVKLTESTFLSDTIVSQATVGTVVNNEGDNDIFAFASVLPFPKISESTLFKLLVSAAEQAQHRTPISSTLISASNKSTNPASIEGLMLHGRFTNFPPPLIYELHRNLKDDILWTKTVKVAELSEQERGELEVDNIQLFQAMDKIYLLCPITFNDTYSAKEISGLKPFQSLLGSNNIIFHSFEDEFYFQQADEVVYVSLPKEIMKNQHHVLISVAINDFDKILKSIEDMLN